jgi:hypothetical protein
MKAKEFLKGRKLDKGRLTMHLDGADYSVDLQNLLEEYANQKVIDELEKITELSKPLRYSDKHDALLDRIKELKR